MIQEMRSLCFTEPSSDLLNVRLQHILKPTSNRSPCILTLVQNVINGAHTIYAFINVLILCRDSSSYFDKMTCTSCTDTLRVKVPIIQNVTLFLRYEIFNRAVINLRFCFFEDVTDYCDVRRINLNSFFQIGPFVFTSYFIIAKYKH